MDYRQAGVDVEAGYEAVKLMKGHAQSTHGPEVMKMLANFGGLFELKGYKEPVLVSGTDGVGTKLKLAFALDKHDTVGIDCVAMCVNDIVCHGAKPLFFLDYIATGKLVPQQAAQIVSGIAEGCRQAGCALTGGETAEMPGFYAEGEYDLAGFAVGAAEKSRIIDGSTIQKGDALIGLSSSGVHSNGFSLIRKIFGETADKLSRRFEGLSLSIGEELLTPTRIYVKTVLELLSAFDVRGIAHITGGGFYENIPRIMPKGLCARVYTDSFEMPQLFKIIEEQGGISKKDMFSTFNMGIGMVLAVPQEQAKEALSAASRAGEKAFIIGEAIEGEGVLLV
ncbi:MAG: phosphoribosylformylglycinamidine cyclo-ligase [Christensenellales bacterium]|jgi:phosphoribosylformylglycinamidine cyclo-ligase